MITHANIETERLLDSAGETIGVLCRIEDAFRMKRYLIGYKPKGDLEVWYCKERTPQSSINVIGHKMDDILERYGVKDLLRNAWKEYRNDG